MITKVIDFEVGADMHMSSLKGYVNTTYDKLVELFGKPEYSDADPYEKVNAEWTVETTVYDDFEEDEKTVKFSIYNWKTGSVPTEKYAWHVGGFSYDAVEAAEAIING